MENLPVRKHPRLKGYDYSLDGAYFITFCVKERHEMLGSVGRDDLGTPNIQLSEYGLIAKEYIENIEAHYKGVIVDKYVVMPNHVHMILLINRDYGAPGVVAPYCELVDS